MATVIGVLAAVVLSYLVFIQTVHPEKRVSSSNSAVSNEDLLNLIQQQAAQLQTLQAQVISSESLLQQQSTSILSLHEQLKDSQNTIQQQSASIPALQTRVGSCESTALQQAQSIRVLESKASSSESAVAGLQAKLSAVESRQQLNVAFAARFGDSQNHIADLGQGGTIKFTDVSTNIGNAYNSSTGIFSTPYPGTYAFFLAVRSDGVHGWIDVGVHKANALTTLCSAVVQGPPELMDKGSCFAVTHLGKGDQVWAAHNSGSTYVEEFYYTMFVGMLIHADELD